MTTKQENRLNMYLAVRDYLIPNEAITKDLPNFGANLTVLRDTIEKIQAFAELQRGDITGLTKQKKQIRNTLITLTSDCSRKVSAFANNSKNTILLNEVKTGKSGLANVTDVALKDHAQIVYEKAQKNLDSLTSYGITAETQKILLDAINQYNDSIAKPRVGIAEKSKATKELLVLFNTADTLIINMDYAVEIIRLTQTTFYNGYKTARKLVDTGTSKLSLKGVAEESGSGNPIKGATFRFIQNGLKSSGANGEIVKNPADGGSFNLKNMASGNYEVVISKPGFVEKKVSVSVSEGEMTEMVVELERG
jgi:hypothetical protein